MQPLPALDVAMPRTIEEAIGALASPGSRLVAGGTDLLPNLKHGLERPLLLVSLGRVEGLRGIGRSDAEIAIGAATTLAEVAVSDVVRREAPSLAQAASGAASPILRNLATLGGNLNLATRCRFVNQSEFWRSALGGCLKAGGSVCHVVDGGQRCVAALSSDCAPVLVSLRASIDLAGPRGTRSLAILDYYRGDGVRHTVREPGEILVRVRVPVAPAPRRATYVRWSPRRSIDFPLVGVALRFDLAEPELDAPIAAACAVAGVLGARPRVVTGLDAVVGRRLSDPRVASLVSDRAFAQCKPLDNVAYDAAYRRHLIRVLLRRAVERLGATGA